MKIRAIAVYGLVAVMFGCDAGADAKAPPKFAGAYSLAAAARQTPWETPFAKGACFTTAHYDIYSTSSNRQVSAVLPGYMEASYQRYLKITGLPEKQIKPMPVYMLGSRQEWAALTEKVVGPQRSAKYQSIEAGGYCYDGVGIFWDMGGQFTLSTAAHEGLHQFLHFRLKDQLPMWLEEGICVTAEGFEIEGNAVTFTPATNAARFNDLREQIVQGRFIGLKKLLTMEAGDVLGRSTEEAVGYYGQLWALVLYIRSNPQYAAGLEKLMNDAAAGKFAKLMNMTEKDFALLRAQGRVYNQAMGEPLFIQYISEDLEGFEKGYQAYAKKLAGLN